MKNFKLLSVLAISLMAFAFTSCDTGSDNSTSLPSKQVAYNMMAQFNGAHQCGILFPGNDDKDNKIEKDSISTRVYISAEDSSYTVSNFPVKNLAKYVKDEKLATAIAALPDQTLSGKLLAHWNGTVSEPLFGTSTNNITFNNEGKEYHIVFYGGYQSTYGLAGKAQDQTTKQNLFLLYLTPGAIYEGTSLISNALKTISYNGYSYPYPVTLRFNL